MSMISWSDSGLRELQAVKLNWDGRVAWLATCDEAVLEQFSKLKFHYQLENECVNMVKFEESVM
jgi:hypothetical protein